MREETAEKKQAHRDRVMKEWKKREAEREARPKHVKALELGTRFVGGLRDICQSVDAEARSLKKWEIDNERAERDPQFAADREAERKKWGGSDRPYRTANEEKIGPYEALHGAVEKMAKLNGITTKEAVVILLRMACDESLWQKAWDEEEHLNPTRGEDYVGWMESETERKAAEEKAEAQRLGSRITGDEKRIARKGPKLTKEKAEEIKELIRRGMTYNSIAAMFGIHPSSVSDIARGVTRSQ